MYSTPGAGCARANAMAVGGCAIRRDQGERVECVTRGAESLGRVARHQLETEPLEQRIDEQPWHALLELGRIALEPRDQHVCRSADERQLTRQHLVHHD